jgi:hypothetical protein
VKAEYGVEFGQASIPAMINDATATLIFLVVFQTQLGADDLIDCGHGGNVATDAV